MDRADEELKETIRHIWPLQSKKMLELLVPPRDGKKILDCNSNTLLYISLLSCKFSQSFYCFLMG